MGTDKLFWKDPYQKEFDATIVFSDNEKIVLDKTCFYPESGGQTSDSGHILQHRVIQTIIEKETNRIVHIINEDNKLNAGQGVHCEIDWDRRYQIMKLHSALHILYLACNKILEEPKLRGSAIESEKARLDIEFFSDINEDAISNFVNELIVSSLDIKTGQLGNEEHRYWEIEGFPSIPCGGTHVKNTSEIGAIKCSVKNKGKQGKRIYMELLKDGTL